MEAHFVTKDPTLLAVAHKVEADLAQWKAELKDLIASWGLGFVDCRANHFRSPTSFFQLDTRKDQTKVAVVPGFKYEGRKFLNGRAFLEYSFHGKQINQVQKLHADLLVFEQKWAQPEFDMPIFGPFTNRLRAEQIICARLDTFKREIKDGRCFVTSGCTLLSFEDGSQALIVTVPFDQSNGRYDIPEVGDKWQELTNCELARLYNLHNAWATQNADPADPIDEDDDDVEGEEV